VAGLRDDDASNGLDVALSAMQQEAAKLRANAEANRMKASALTTPPATSQDNRFVKEALAAAQGVKPTSSAVDRLAALKK
jgi:hypothetical protein